MQKDSLNFYGVKWEILLIFSVKKRYVHPYLRSSVRVYESMNSSRGFRRGMIQGPYGGYKIDFVTWLLRVSIV